MGNLEHSVREAFVRQEHTEEWKGKNDMWSRLNNSIRIRKGVAAIWRVAAVFLGLLLATGVIASIGIRRIQQQSKEQLMIENARIAALLDSARAALNTTYPTEVGVVEKERIVYRDKITYEQQEGDWKQKLQALNDSIRNQSDMANEYEHIIAELRKDLRKAQQELVALKAAKINTAEEKDSAPFVLKSERVELKVQKKPKMKSKSPEIEMKVFYRKQKQFKQYNF